MSFPSLENVAKDLSKEPPRSPRERIHGYAIMARMIDKGRAEINDTVGEYHFDCPVDNKLFDFKRVQADDVRQLLATGADDEAVARWFEQHGEPKNPDEVEAWSAAVEADRPFENPEKRDWFKGECEPLGLDPKKTTLFEYLETDDRVSFEEQG